ncbi:MAG TPA: hypothetical protein VHO25_18510, partial [Polyangiaceae bacterium]|nr:hypothetical protein [Polyangiaceae bacterium]
RVLRIVTDQQSPARGSVQAIATASGIPVGHVRTILEAYGIQGLYGPRILMTQSQYENMEADLEMPIEDERVVATVNQFNVKGGDGSQVQVGQHVSGNQSMDYSQVFENVIATINGSSMPPVEKSSALEKLKDLLMSNGVATAFGIGANALQKWFGQ